MDLRRYNESYVSTLTYSPPLLDFIAYISPPTKRFHYLVRNLSSTIVLPRSDVFIVDFEHEVPAGKS